MSGAYTLINTCCANSCTQTYVFFFLLCFFEKLNNTLSEFNLLEHHLESEASDCNLCFTLPVCPQLTSNNHSTTTATKEEEKTKTFDTHRQERTNRAIGSVSHPSIPIAWEWHSRTSRSIMDHEMIPLFVLGRTQTQGNRSKNGTVRS